MKESVKRTLAAGMVSFLCIALLVPIRSAFCVPGSASQDSALSTQNDNNDPNTESWTRWDAPIKNPDDPNEILKTKWGSLVDVLQSKEVDQEQKKQIIDKIITPIFDTNLMAMLVLGRTNWAKLDSDQQKKFTDLFAKRIKSFYLEKTALYNQSEKVTFKPGTKNRSSIYVPMVIKTKDQEVNVLYKLRKLPEADRAGKKIYWKIYDVEIEGVSVLLTYQSQFDEILRKGSVQDLFDQLEKPASK